MTASPTVAKWIKHWYPSDTHPYRVYSRLVRQQLRAQDVLLDYGCGRAAPDLAQYSGNATRLIGTDILDFRIEDVSDMELLRLVPSQAAGGYCIPLESGTVDLVMSRSVVEHLTDPESTFREIARVLRPGGRFIFLTANKFDYGSVIAMATPNRWHAKVVEVVEGRPQEDTFPTAYRANTARAIGKLSTPCGFRVAQIRFLNQYPNYLMFSAPLFLLGVLYERITSSINFLAPLRGWILCELVRQDSGTGPPTD